MLKTSTYDLYVTKCCTKVGISILNNDGISCNMHIYKKYPNFSIVYYVIYYNFFNLNIDYKKMYENKILPCWYQLSFIDFENNYNSDEDSDYDPELDNYYEFESDSEFEEY